MTLQDIENYIKILEVNPNSKYLLVVSRQSGIFESELQRLKLNENFLDSIMLVNGRPDEVITSIPITKN